MRKALELVKREMGADAVILGTRTLSSPLARLTGSPTVEITAAPGTATLPGRPENRRPSPQPRRESPGRAVGNAGDAGRPPVDPGLYPLYVELVKNEVAEDVAAELLASLPKSTSAEGSKHVLRALRDRIAQLVEHRHEPASGTAATGRLAFVGPAGAGKTTAVAKLAAQFKLKDARRVGVLSLDTHRPGAVEQLRRYVEVLEVPLRTAQTVMEVQQALRDLKDVDVLLIDTAGVGLRDRARFARQFALLRAARPTQTHLVLPATNAPDVQVRIAQAFEPLGAKRVLLTRLDDVMGFGVIVNVIQKLSMGVSYYSTGQNVPQDLEMACGLRVAKLLLCADE